MTEYGAICLIPSVVVLVVALLTHRTIAAVVCGATVAFMITDQLNFVSALSGAALTVMQEETTGWVLLVCGLYGSFIALLVRGGGAQAFGNLVSSHVHSKEASLMWTWVLGVVIFLDDYLNALTVSSSMKKVTDKYKTSREMLSYVVDSTAAPMCLIIPISTWGVYFAGSLEKNGVVPAGEGMDLLFQSIPYMFYPIAAVIIVPLAIFKIIPLLGTMKTAELRAEQFDLVIPPGCEHLELEDPYQASDARDPSIWAFFIPVFSLIFFTVWFDIDVLQGVIAGLFVTIAQYLITRQLSLYEMFDTTIDGLKTMLPVLSILVAVFTFIEANNAMGFTQYIIETVSPHMTAKLLPVLTFATMALVSFATGSNWGVFALTIPVVFPLADVFGVDKALMAGALFSASGFGSQACFFSDSTVLAAQGSGCGSYEHAMSQLPYGLLGAAVAAVGFYFVA